MLNYDTLLSSYDDKLTLMQWLKKVEAALNDASAVSFNVNKRGDATLTFSVVFEDGSELESNPITLQQGESVASAYIQNGNLHLVLTNGDDLDAGNMFNGNVNITGSLQVNDALKVNVIGPISGDNVPFMGGGDFNGNVNVEDGDINVGDGHISTPILTSPNVQIEAQKPVVEVMTGYVFAVGSKAGMSLSPIYVGACKNGNKLTLVYYVSFTRTDTIADAFATLGSVTIPNSVLSKLFPYSIGDSVAALDYKQVGFYKKSNAAQVLIKSYVEKVGGGVVYTCTGLNSLDINEEYIVRFENTFLLSENLAA